MIYATILILLMIMSTITKIISMYLGLPQYSVLVDAMNNLVMATLIVKSSIIITTFVIGEIKNNKLGAESNGIAR